MENCAVSLSSDEFAAWWAAPNDGAQQILEPSKLHEGSPKTTTFEARSSEIELFEIFQFLRKLNVSVEAYIHAAWALVMRAYIMGNAGAITFPLYFDTWLGYGDLRCRPCQIPASNRSMVSTLLKAIQREWESDTMEPVKVSHALASPTPFLGQPRWPCALAFCRGPDSELRLRDAFQHRLLPHNVICIIRPICGRLTSTLAIHGHIQLAIHPRRILFTLHTYLEALVKDPLGYVSYLPSLSNEDIKTLESWNSSTLPKIQASIPLLVQQSMRQNPNREAIHSWDGSLTYEELFRRSARLSKELQRRGGMTGSIVPVQSEKSKNSVIAMLAILMAGAICVPIDHQAPPVQLGSIMESTKPRVVLCGKSCLPNFSKWSAECIDIESYPWGPQQGEQWDNNFVKPDTVAFLLFSSGSTGPPKGVLLDHAALCTSLIIHGKAMNIDRTARVFQFASFAFDVCISDIFATLTLGGCVCIPSKYDRLYNLKRVVNLMGATHLHLTPTMIGLLSPADFPNVRVISSGGETLSKDIIAKWSQDVQLNNVYGSAECSIDCAGAFNLTRSSHPNDIGKGLGANLWVVDVLDCNALVPIGTVGELLVEGPILARGYFKNAERTYTAFRRMTAFPYKNTPAEGRGVYYKTGDLVRYDRNGRLLWVGRKDFLIKYHGRWVDTEAIGNFVTALYFVSKAVCLVSSSGAYAGQLVVAFERAPQTVTNTQCLGNLDISDIEGSPASCQEVLDIQHEIQAKLPTSPIPSQYLRISCIPTMASGKVNRSLLLRWLCGVRLPLTTSGTLPMGLVSSKQQTDEFTKELFKHIFELLQGRHEKSYEPDFVLSFAGLDSIVSIKISNLIQEKYHVTLPAAVFMRENLSIASLCKLIQKARGRSDDLSPSTIITFEEDLKTTVPKVFLHGPKLAATPELRNNRTGAVLLTGATGFVGTHLLRMLLLDPGVKSVAVLVRAGDPGSALARVISSATKARWWHDTLSPRLQIWLGDLSLPHLGLEARLWDKLCGVYPQKSHCIDTIVHCGSVVFWQAEYNTLRTVNVLGTLQLLRAALLSNHVGMFIYISGGSFRRHCGVDDKVLQKELETGTGYSQTKFVAELLVERFSKVPGAPKPKCFIIKPGMVIGSARHGVANTDDFLWRTVATVLRVRTYPQYPEAHYFSIMPVDRVAEAVKDCLAARSGKYVKTYGKIACQEFWNIVKDELSVVLRPDSIRGWLDAAQLDIDEVKESHWLWPFSDQLWHHYEAFARLTEHKETDEIVAHDTGLAIRSNLRFLRDMGYFSTGWRMSRSTHDWGSLFSRSSL